MCTKILVLIQIKSGIAIAVKAAAIGIADPALSSVGVDDGVGGHVVSEPLEPVNIEFMFSTASTFQLLMFWLKEEALWNIALMTCSLVLEAYPSN